MFCGSSANILHQIDESVQDVTRSSLGILKPPWLSQDWCQAAAPVGAVDRWEVGCIVPAVFEYCIDELTGNCSMHTQIRQRNIMCRDFSYMLIFNVSQSLDLSTSCGNLSPLMICARVCVCSRKPSPNYFIDTRPKHDLEQHIDHQYSYSFLSRRYQCKVRGSRQQQIGMRDQMTLFKLPTT